MPGGLEPLTFEINFGTSEAGFVDAAAKKWVPILLSTVLGKNVLIDSFPSGLRVWTIKEKIFKFSGHFHSWYTSPKVKWPRCNDFKNIQNLTNFGLSNVSVKKLQKLHFFTESIWDLNIGMESTYTVI